MNSFSNKLSAKIAAAKHNTPSHKIASLELSSPLFMAPMAGITNAPFRLLMQDLGAGATVSELISCKAICYNNQKTLDMLTIDSREKNSGIQLFGGDADAMSNALKFVADRGAPFIDLNLGCPVKKVAASGGGAALLKETAQLGHYLKKCRQAITIPLSIKIRSGWDTPNAHEVVKIAYEEGIDFIAIHGRTANQQYKGSADWNYIEEVASRAKLPIIGNGDLVTPEQIIDKMKQSACDALMIGRGVLRNPFIFLQSFSPATQFYSNDYFEIIQRYHYYLSELTSRQRAREIQLKKHIAWFLAGFSGVARFRESLFKAENEIEIIETTHNYVETLCGKIKENRSTDQFLTAGHG